MTDQLLDDGSPVADAIVRAPWARFLDRVMATHRARESSSTAPGDGGREVLLVHPGGPFWARKDLGAWSIPKGEHDDGEDPRACALREFAEETGTTLPDGALADLGDGAAEERQAGARRSPPRATSTPRRVRSNTFELEWPPRSGRRQAFPEVDRAAWFGLDEARAKLNPAQAAFVDRLEALLAGLRCPGWESNPHALAGSRI